MEVETTNSSYTLVDLVDRILDKGLVINADISVSLVGVELLGIKIRASLASFETAAKWGLEFPGGTSKETEAWKKAHVQKEKCPQCGKMIPEDNLMNHGCPWCGWTSAKSKRNFSDKETEESTVDKTFQRDRNKNKGVEDGY
ncbi:gas vesicle protein [bacterium]|nr:gas vesicle protein [bacterium]